MTDGEKMIWAAAYVATFNAECPREAGVSESQWTKHAERVQQAVVVAIERATLTVQALCQVTTKGIEDRCCDEAPRMLSGMLDCDDHITPP